MSIADILFGITGVILALLLVPFVIVFFIILLFLSLPVDWQRDQDEINNY
ncbi:MAG: hypothetical protein ACJ75J_16415 [Cytophagaceae bacterium]